MTVIEHLDDGTTRRIDTTREGLFDVVAGLLYFGGVDPDDEDAVVEVAATVETLLADGIVRFEGDKPIELVRDPETERSA